MRIQEDTKNTLRELAEAQRRTEERLGKVEARLDRLEENQKKIREQLGGLAHTVGYSLEDKAYKGLPGLINKDFGIEVKELRRDYVKLPSGRYEEVNIIGEGWKDGSRVWIIGECKTQLKRRDVDSFLRKVVRIGKVMEGEKLLVMVAYQATPQVRDYVKSKGIALYFSYQF